MNQPEKSLQLGRTCITIIIYIIISLLTPFGWSQSDTQSNIEINSIPEPARTYVKAVAERNLDALLACFHSNAVIIEVNRRIEGIDEIRRWAENEVIGGNLIDVWVYYDGYGDFNSLGELMERFQDGITPSYRYVRNKKFPVELREDIFSMMRFPKKFKEQMILNDAQVNYMYNEMVNGILDAYVFIWKCSGMDMAHPSYPVPPGTIISKPTQRKVVTGGALQAMMQASQEREEEDLPEAIEEEAPEETPPPAAQPQPAR